MSWLSQRWRERTGYGAGYRKVYISTAISSAGDGVSSIAYPWLASAVTRNPVLVAMVVAVERLPNLFFVLPAGVITDRGDRKKLMVAMDSVRFVLTLAVALAVLSQQGTLPLPDQVKHVVGTRVGLYVVLLVSTLLLGMAGVLRNNCAQTILPDLVDAEHLEKANGRIWSVEAATMSFIGPPLGSAMLLAAFSAPFFLDAASFFAAAGLIASIPGSFKAARPDHVQHASFSAEMKEGFRWLMRHPLLRPMAIILGFMNMASSMSGAVMVLFAQDVLHTGAFTFAVMGFGWALASVLGGYAGPWMSKHWGAGPCLSVTIAAAAVTPFLVGVSTHWTMVMVLTCVGTLLQMSWNVITVSLRQTIIPGHLFGRVNSSYRFFALGMMPVGAALGGATVSIAEHFTSHSVALRWVFFLEALVHVVLWFFARPRLTTERIEQSRAAAVSASTASPAPT